MKYWQMKLNTSGFSVFTKYLKDREKEGKNFAFPTQRTVEKFAKIISRQKKLFNFVYFFSKIIARSVILL